MKTLTADQTKQLRQIESLATSLFDNIWEDAAMWIQSPQTQFFNESPLQLLATDRGQAVIDWLEVRAGKKPGAAF